ncbi:MAG: DUF2892 domain-containing protein [Nitrospira sp.]|nr:DUF2892 domain-containing protein [Nitrospira sp.]
MLEKVREIINRDQVRQTWQQLTQTDRLNVNESERLASLVSGGLLTLYGLNRRSPGGFSSLLTGGYLIYRGLTGYCPAYEALHINTASPMERIQLQAGEEDRVKASERPRHTIVRNDNVDEAVWETFPASDPPANW